MFDPARLNARIWPSRRTTSGQGSLGTPGEAWTPDVTPLAAERKDVSDGEKGAAGGKIATLRTRFVVRRSTRTESLTVKDRVAHVGRAFDIVGVKRLAEDDRFLELTCEARAEA